MPHFEESYTSFRYPLRADGLPGFRIAQLGAIHSAAGHFANRTDPGIITMPTGSGKTAVLIAAAYVLRAQRVLVITPSRLVREQIAEEIATLATLKETGALPNDHPVPRVFSTKHRVRTSDEWEAMREYDVVVGTVQSISPEFADIPEPPADLFDLVLVDEAHHSPARTWQSVLNHFASAKRLLFTATPFRQDQKEIKGRFIFTYDLRDAFDDGIFGETIYQPVTAEAGQEHDEAIARAAERQFIADREAGYQHHVMVRTDSRKRATELLTIYERDTNLRLSIVTGDKSLRYVKRVIQQLNDGQLDGIVCVNMLGEGFNFPSLKIAAIHSPHKSLSVTLQFIGRFARTAGEHLGPATFLAIPSDIEIEAERLYDTRAVWQDIVQNLSQARITQEADLREVLDSFNSLTSTPDLTDLSLYVLEPYYHVKVYQLDAAIDIEQEITFPNELQVVYHGVSVPHNAAIYITREISLPRWTTDDRLSRIQPELFIFYHDIDTNLLFICASRRTAGLYEQLTESFADADPRPLPLVRLNKALNDLTEPEFFNVGMRNRVSSNTTESYRIITGSNADKAILKSDGRLYHRGHAFGRASEGGDTVTIGLSSASKIWSNKSSKLPELIEWCAKLARKISSDRIPITNSGLDYLDAGEELDALPTGIVAVDWPANLYRTPPVAHFTDGLGVETRATLLDFNLSIDQAETTDAAIMINLSHNDFVYRFTFSFETNSFFEPASDREPEIVLEHNRGLLPLLDFINEEMLLFYTSDLSVIDGYNIFRAPTEALPPLDERSIEVLDWAAANVNIAREFGNAGRGRQSIHAYMATVLEASDSSIVYYDHGTGEIADFIAFEETEGRLLVRFYHCKGATGAAPGHRLADIAEVTGQTVKSVTWARKQRIMTSIRRRFTTNVGSHQFVKGDLESLETLLTSTTPASIDFEFIAVQPGLQKAGLTLELSNMLAAASDHLVRAGFKPLRMLAS